MALLNYSTTVSVDRTVAQIQKILASHGATRVMAEYDGQGIITSISFWVDTPYGNFPYTIPIDTAACEAVLRRQYGKQEVPRSALRQGQPQRIAWRIVKDWIESQMALLETQMVTLDQIFLPYLRLNDTTTMYDHMVQDGFRLALPQHASQ